MTVRTAFISCLTLMLAGSTGRANETLVSNPRELSEACKQARPGDTIFLTEGEWKDAVLVVSGKGTEKAPITVRARTPGKTILVGESRLRIGGEHVTVEGLWFRRPALDGGHVIEFRTGSRSHARHCRLTACAVTDVDPTAEKGNTKWVSLYGRHNRVDRCYFEGKQTVGPTLVVWLDDQPNFHRIDRNHFGPRPPLGQNGGETIRVGTSNWSLHESRTIVEGNLFEECDGEIEIISNKSCDNVYRNNVFLRCRGTLTLRHGDRCHVHGNWFLGEGRRSAGGVRIIGEDHRVYNNYFDSLPGTGARSAISVMNGVPDSPLAGYLQVIRVIIAFNTIRNCRAPVTVGLRSRNATLPPTDCVFANNIAVGTGDELVRQTTEPIDWVWIGNLLHGGKLSVEGEEGLRVVDPELVENEDGIFQPAPKSPANGVAMGLFAFVDDDIYGRPRGRAKTVGCFEPSDAPLAKPPVGKDDVGPKWRRDR